MDVGVEVALSTAIGRPAFHRCKPVSKARVFFPQRVAFVVVKTRIHPFDVGRKDDIRSAKFIQEIRAGSARECCFDLGDNAGELVAVAFSGRQCTRSCGTVALLLRRQFPAIGGVAGAA